jgi:hypothetical protein
MTTRRYLPIDEIRTDGGTQIRLEIDQETVQRYHDAMADSPQNAPHPLPPIDVYHDKKAKAYWLTDGFHRHAAAKRLGRLKIACNVTEGNREAAILEACMANATHGLPRSNADKRRAVETFLRLRPDWSDRNVAAATHTSHTFVAQTRARLAGELQASAALDNQAERLERIGRDGKKHKTKTKPKTLADGQEAQPAAGPTPAPGRHFDFPPCPRSADGGHEWLEGACAQCHEPDPTATLTPDEALAAWDAGRGKRPTQDNPDPAKQMEAEFEADQARIAARAAAVAQLPAADPAREYERIMAEDAEAEADLEMTPGTLTRPADPNRCDRRFTGYAVWDAPSRTWYTGRGTRFTDAPLHAKYYADMAQARAAADWLNSTQARHTTVAGCYEPDETDETRRRCPCCNGAGKIPREPQLPDELNTPAVAQAWQEWNADRKARKQPVTAIAARKQIALLAKLGPALAVEAIEASIAHGWIGLFDPREKAGKRETVKLTNQGKAHKGKVAAL